MAAMADPWDQLSVMSSSCQKSSESLMPLGLNGAGSASELDEAGIFGMRGRRDDGASESNKSEYGCPGTLH